MLSTKTDAMNADVAIMITFTTLNFDTASLTSQVPVTKFPGKNSTADARIIIVNRSFVSDAPITRFKCQPCGVTIASAIFHAEVKFADLKRTQPKITIIKVLMRRNET